MILDIGGQVGALLVRVEASWVHRQIEVSRANSPSAPRVHAVVRGWHVSGVRIHAAVFPTLETGSYRLWDPDGRPLGTADVPAAGVADVAVTNG